MIKNKNISKPLVFIFSLLALTACTLTQGSAPTATIDAAPFFTQAVQTMESEMTQQAAILGEPTFTATSLPTATSEPAATNTLPPIQAATAIPPTRIVPSFTPVPAVCDRAQFVRDLTVEDQSPFAPGTTFVKTWRLKNIGSCTWTQDYDLVLVSGSALNANQVIPLPQKVGPNQTIDISIKMKAPDKLGTYRGDWMLSNSSGTRFGIGANGDKSFWVNIRVMNLGNPGLVYDFAARACQAKWQSGVGDLPCPGTRSGTEGFVIMLDNPRLENRQENELSLWTHPNNALNGWISGVYPEFTVKENQRFVAWVGCLVESKGCNLLFRLDYLNQNGVVKNLASWREVYDGEITKIDLGLSELTGKTVRFILTVETRGEVPLSANAFWFVPGIVQQPTVPTPTAVPPTETPEAYP